MSDRLSSIARNGVLRAAVNRALVQVDGDALTGLSPMLARRLAEAIGARLEPVMYSGAGKVFADAEADRWDVAFLAIDATRAKRVSFTRPYHVIEATYAVRKDSDIQTPEDADRDKVHVLTSTGSAYDMYLSANLALAEFRDGRCDAVAGVRASLERFFDGDPAVRILPGVLIRVEQAMVLPGPDNPAIGALDAFVADAIAEGL